ncbi:MAG: ankyrin repeat domain-containing protein [Planctomycetes bacterium]|nr:ankyrin repeat domain-containing protein [Planctomycetota bacterium]
MSEKHEAGQGADIHAQDFQGKTPLHCAAGFADSRIIQMLVKAGADLSVRNTDDETPRNYAERLERKENVRFLETIEAPGVQDPTQ